MDALKAEMLEAFLAIPERADQHVRDRRQAIGGPLVAASVERQRAMSGATGVPETAGDPEDAPTLVEEWVDDPSMTPAELYYRLDREHDKAQREGRKPSRTIGKVLASVNLRGVVGGFCRFHGTEIQNRACAKLKSLYERSQVGGAKAVDPSLEPVDGGGINPEANIEIGADARREYNRVRALLGWQDLERIEFVVIREHGPTRYAAWRGFEDNGRGRAKAAVEVRGIADRLAEHWQFQGRRAG